MSEPASETDADGETDDDPLSERRKARVTRGLNYLLLFGLAVFALVAAVGFYTSMLDVIETWVTEEFQSTVRAAFNLVVLLVVGAGIVVQVRRLH